MSTSRPFTLNRRSALAGGALLLVGYRRARYATEGGACRLTPEYVEGPYYLDRTSIRGDLREDRAGVPLSLDIAVFDARTCRPLPGAAVDVWHCDANGVYSGFTAENARPMPPGGPPHGGPPPNFPGGPPPFGPHGPPPAPPPTNALTFLRGTQVTDAQGVVRFATVYPGWYGGRAVHIHMKVRTEGAVRGDRYAGGHVAHVGQLFPPEALSDEVFKLPAYVRQGERTRQSDDPIFRIGGEAGLLAMAGPLDDGHGLRASVTVFIDAGATPEVRR